ncbi:conserved Plasmodium protein, unknown function [Plasmodium vivax]|uniref:Uncharacterized protein n=1 Tax=Plasmodium vivax TaxID=5855 RepID=A0A564ZPL8_PLAVI|nr:conserved Plasmodium protein, unknown function [Plasmodium vivax]
MHKRKASAPVLGDRPSDSKRRCERGTEGDASFWRKAKSEGCQTVDDALLKCKGGTAGLLEGLRFGETKELATRLGVPPVEDIPVEDNPVENIPVEGGSLCGAASKGHPQSNSHRSYPPAERLTSAQLSILEKGEHEEGKEERNEEAPGGEANFERMNDVGDPLCGGMPHEGGERGDVKQVGMAHFEMASGFITKGNADQLEERIAECPSSDLPQGERSPNEGDDDVGEEEASDDDHHDDGEEVFRDGKMAASASGGKPFEEDQPELRRNPSGYPPLLSTLSDELLCCTSNGSDETNKRSGTHEWLALPKGKEGESPLCRSSQVDVNHHGDVPSDEEKTFCETLTSDGTSSKRVYHFRRSKDNIHIYTPGGGTYLTIEDHGEETPESVTSEQSSGTLQCGSGQLKVTVKREVNPGERLRDPLFVNTQRASFLRSTDQSNHTDSQTGVRTHEVMNSFESAQMNGKSLFADGPAGTTPHEERKYACVGSLHPRRRSAPGRTRKRKLTPMTKKKVKAEKKKKKKIPGRIYKVIVRGKECWRAEWFVQRGFQEMSCNATAKVMPKMKTETGSGSDQVSRPYGGEHPPLRSHNHGNENSFVKKSKQFSVSVYGPENARLFALFELIKYNSVPDGLREEANVCICNIKKNLMVQGGSADKSRSGHFLPLMLAGWDDAYSPALFRKIQGDMVHTWGQFTDGGGSDVHMACSGIHSGSCKEPPRAAPRFDGHSFPRKGNPAGGFDQVDRRGGDFASLGGDAPSYAPSRRNDQPTLMSNHPNRLPNCSGHADNPSAHHQNNLVHSINAYNLHSRHMAHMFAANKPSMASLHKSFNSSDYAYRPHGEELVKLQNGFSFGQLNEQTSGINRNWALRVNHPGYHYNYARGDDKMNSMASCASLQGYPNGYANSHEDVRGAPENPTADLAIFGSYFHSDGNAVNCKMEKSAPAFGPKMSNGGGSAFDQFGGGAAHLKG